MKSRTYRFTEKDPVCGEVMNMVDQAGLRGKQHVGKIAILATIAHGTAEGILYGDTKRPRNDTVMKIATALGFKREWVRDVDNWKVEDELVAARKWIKQQRALMDQEAKSKPRVKKKRAKGKPKLRLVKSAA